ncbi:MAG: hypothetical protein WC998_09150 [Candidatus Paceibacterota bacterium]
MKQPKRPRGRPLGGKAPAAVREFWRNDKRDYRAKMGKEAKKDLNQSRRRKL